jgi:hypothetical protein
VTLYRIWQHRVHKTNKNKTKTQQNMCWTSLYANEHKTKMADAMLSKSEKATVKKPTPPNKRRKTDDNSTETAPCHSRDPVSGVTLYRIWQHRVHKTNKNKTKTQQNMCWTSLYANEHKKRK